MAKVSVIIVSFKTGDILARAIDSALSQEDLHELIFVNNGNPDKILENLNTLAKKEPKLKIVTGHGNVGFASGCNIGVKHSTGEYILLMNPDSLLSKQALVRTVEEMERFPETWLAGCQMIHPDGKLQGGSKRNLLTPEVAISQASYLYKFGTFGKFKPMNLDESGDETESYFVPAISGAFMMMKLDKYLEIGGMDEDYFFHVEDLDLCLNVNKRGGKVLYIPSVKTIHYRGSSKVSSFFVEKNKTDGFVKYFKKHSMPSGYLFYLVVFGIYFRFILRFPQLIYAKFFGKRKMAARAEKKKRQMNLLTAPIRISSYSNHKEPVILAGGTGQVGLNILRRLLASNITTYSLYNKQVIDYRHSKLKWLQCDLSTDLSHLQNSLIDLEKPKTLIHTPAIWLLPQHLDKFAKMGITRLICFSSTSIMGKSSSENIYEKDLLRKFINSEKEIAEKCEELGIEWTIFRPTMIYGSGLDHNVSSIVKFIKTFGFFPVTDPGKGLRQPVHADDLASAVLNVLSRPETAGKVYNLGGGTKTSYVDMVGEIFDTMDKKKRILKTDMLPVLLDIFSFISRRKDINGEIAKRMNMDLVFDDTNAKNDFGYTSREFLESGVEDLGIVA